METGVQGAFPGTLLALLIMGKTPMHAAAITMAYNENNNLGMWTRHYAKQFGEVNLFVLDHGSDDGSTDNMASVNVIRIPRSPLDEVKRADSVSHLANALLPWYDYVLYSDADELIVADPEKYSGILDYLERKRPSYVNSLGINILHDTENEAELDYAAPISTQRKFGMFAAPMSKPNITSIPVEWAAGFHHRDLPARFDDIFLFHMRYADLKSGLTRLDVTRNLNRAVPNSLQHQQVSDDGWAARLHLWNGKPVVDDDPWSINRGRLSEYAARFCADEFRKDGENMYRAGGTLHLGDELFVIPERFVGSF